MRPQRIEFQAFGPYAGREEVDFNALSEKGLFLICGKTGIGKTMILDAMTFALFGKSSGHGRDTFENMRCTKADFDTTTFVKFEFENNGEEYLFERRLERKRKNLSLSYNAAIKNGEGIWQPLMENPKDKAVTEKAEELLGLDYEQFRQVIILPQGQFERFLTSGSDEKEKILTSIFGEKKWQIIADSFYEKAESRKNRLREISEKIRNSLSEEDCETIGELEEVIKQKRDEDAALDIEYKAKDYDKVIKEQQEQLALINTLKNAKEALKKREDEEEEAVRHAEEKKKAFEDAEEALKAHSEKEKETEEKRKLKILYEGKRGDYEGLREAEEELEKISRAVSDARKEEKAVKESCEEYSKLTARLKDEFDELQEEHSALLNNYLAGITGELAAKLESGKPCPVCGSTEHPKKAEISETHVTKEEVDRVKKNADKKYRELQKEAAEQEKAKGLADKKHAALERLNTELAAREAQLESRKKNLISGVSSAEELETEIKRIDKSIAESEALKIRLEDLKKKAGDAYTAAKAGIASAKKETREARKACDETMDNLKAELKGEEMPDEEKCRELLDIADNGKGEYREKKAVLTRDMERLTEKVNTLKNEGSGIEEKIREADEDLTFAKRLRGDTGTGLQRYVLGIMFSSVISAANRMLEMVHGGRYRLYRSDDKAQGKNKRGLELKVFDRNSADHDGRFVSTLSGGEKFLVSLALSIGMSTVAQKSGIKIEALFIDEGFGSLDEDSVADAMNVLNSIREANGLVGIISHVQILEDQIASKLRVEEDIRGSHIVRTVG